MAANPSPNSTFSVLSIDIGSVNTRAVLFDEVDGQYHFIGEGTAPTSLFPPLNDVNEGLYQALDHLQSGIGTVLMDDHGRLVIPSQPDGVGVDRVVVTFSAGPEIRIVTLGLLKEFSLQAATDLANTAYARVVEKVSSSDQRSTEMQMDAILKSSPDIFLFAGGVEEGASRSIEKMIDLLVDVYRVMPPERNPEVIYAGNRQLAESVTEKLKQNAEVHITENLRPTIESENPTPARDVLAKTITNLQLRRIPGIKELESISSTPILPNGYRFGQIIEFLGKLYESEKGVVGIDLGSSWTTIAAANGKRYSLRSMPYGVGVGITDFLKNYPVEELVAWMKLDIPIEEVANYLSQKSLFPSSIPANNISLEIEQALARQILLRSGREFLDEWIIEFAAFEPIIASGSYLSRTSSASQALLMLLDGIQPIGVTTVLLDAHSLTASLGAAAPLTPYLPVQVLESSAYTNLGAVISPVAFEKAGTTILKAIVEYPNGNITRTDIKQGTITSLPVTNGQTVNIHLEPVRQVLIDPFKNLSGFKVLGGQCGVVVDARGRPLELPKDANQRKELLKKWSTSLVE
jgi:hypothetical protein